MNEKIKITDKNLMQLFLIKVTSHICKKKSIFSMSEVSIAFHFPYTLKLLKQAFGYIAFFSLSVSGNVVEKKLQYRSNIFKMVAPIVILQ